MSTLRIRSEGADLCINLADILEHLPPESLPDLIDSLAITDAVIEQVTNQIVDGVTDLGSWAAHDDGEAVPRRALEVARRKVALAAPALAAEQVQKMAAKLAAAEATIARVRAEADRRETIGFHGQRRRDDSLDLALRGDA